MTNRSVDFYRFIHLNSSCTHMCYNSGGQSTATFMWIPGMEFRSSSLAVSILTHLDRLTNLVNNVL